MPLAPPPPAERERLLHEALSPLPPTEQTTLLPVLDALFESVLTADSLLHDDVDNPVSHHTTVLEHILEIAVGERFSSDEIRRAAAIAILHDMQPAPKITREARARAKTSEERANLELKNLENRIVHMGLGCVKARATLEALNQRLGREVFSPADIEAIGSVIAIHDLPSINLPIPAAARLAAAFREADRLWMLSRAGVLADLARKKNSSPTDADSLGQVRSNLDSFKAERGLYPPGEDFRDDTSFLRTQTGHAIFQRYLGDWFHHEIE